MPADLAELLADLHGAREDSGSAMPLQLLTRIRTLASKRLSPDDRLRHVMDSEDLAQDTLVDLIGAVDQFRGSTWSEFLAFARALLERRQIDTARHQRVRRLHAADHDRFGEQTLEDSQRSPSTQAATAEEVQRLEDLVIGLPARYREALRLRLNHASYDEVAECLGISKANARQRVSRALEILRSKW